MIEAVIFDVGGVLVRTSSWDLRQKWEDRLNLEAGQLDELVFGDPHGVKAQLGEISTGELWKLIGEDLSLTETELKGLQTDFWANDFLDMNLVNLLGQIKKGCRLAILSNAMDNLRELLSGRYPISRYFDVIVSSAEEGIMKPEKEIYLRTVRRLSVQPEESLFIDDSEQNVLAARETGLQVVRYYSELDLKKELYQRGIIHE